MKEDRQDAICKNAVDVLATMCAGSSEKIIDELTGYLWNEEEAGQIKEAKLEAIFK